MCFENEVNATHERHNDQWLYRFCLDTDFFFAFPHCRVGHGFARLEVPSGQSKVSIHEPRSLSTE
jgi:hypothetical protein